MVQLSYLPLHYGILLPDLLLLLLPSPTHLFQLCTMIRLSPPVLFVPLSQLVLQLPDLPVQRIHLFTLDSLQPLNSVEKFNLVLLLQLQQLVLQLTGLLSALGQFQPVPLLHCKRFFQQPGYLLVLALQGALDLRDLPLMILSLPLH